MKNINLLPTSGPEFAQWFSGSKAIDLKGAPLLVFHGSSVEKTVFDPSLSLSKIGSMFIANKQVANSYGEFQYQAYLSLKNPIYLNISEYNKKQVLTDVAREQWRSALAVSGHDGVIVDNNGSSFYIVFSDKQVLIVHP